MHTDIHTDTDTDTYTDTDMHTDTDRHSDGHMKIPRGVPPVPATSHVVLLLRALTAVAVISGPSACLVDDDAPAAPVLDPLPAATSLETVVVSGTAEYLAQVAVSGGAAVATGAADGRTGRFAVEVKLADGENDLIVTATDSEGNASTPAAVLVAREPPRAESIRLVLESSIIDADSAELAVQLEVGNDEPAIDLSALGVTLRVEGYVKDVTPVPVTPDRTGHARAVVAGLDAVGSGLLVAEADVAAPDGSRARAEAGFFVVAGAPTQVTLELAAVVDGTPVGPANAISVPPATDVDATVTVEDQAGNIVRGLPQTVAVAGDPGALVFGNQIRNVTKAGDHLVVASLGADLLGAEATLTVIPGDPASIDLALTPAETLAGDDVAVTARVIDAFGNIVDGAACTLTTDVPATDPLGAPQALAVTSVAGGADGLLAAHTAGSFIITASAAGLADVTRPLVVRHAAPLANDFLTIDAATPHLAGDPVLFTYAFQDAFGNVFFDVPLVVSVNAPNISVALDGSGHGEIDGIVRAGSYTVRGRAVGAAIADALATIVVEANPVGAGFNLILSASLVAEQGSVLFFASDGFGNALSAAAVTVTTTGPAAVAQDQSRLTFDVPGTYGVTACVVAAPQLCDTEFVSVQGLVDTIPPTTSIAITFPDPAQSSEVPPRGLVTVRVTSSDDRGLASVRIVASFGGNLGCAVQSTPVLLPAGTVSDSRTFSFQLPRCAAPLDDVAVVAQAEDQAGNTANSGGHTPLTVAAPFTISSPGFIVSVAAFRDRLQSPHDVAADQTTGELFVTNNGNDEVIVVAPDRTQQRALDRNGNRLQPVRPEGIALDENGNILIHASNAGNGNPGLERLRADFTDDAPLIDSNVIGAAYPATPFGLDVDESPGLTHLMCAAVRGSDRVQCFTNTGVTGATITMPINIQNAGTRPVGIAFDPPSAADNVDRLFVAEGQARQIRELVFNGTRTTLASQRTINLNVTGGIANQNDIGDLEIAPGSENLIVTEMGRGRVLRVTQAGVVSEIATGFSQPIGLAFDVGDLLVVDAALDTVFRISPDPASPGVF